MYGNIALHILGWILEKLLKTSTNITFFAARTFFYIDLGEFQTGHQTKLFLKKNQDKYQD